MQYANWSVRSEMLDAIAYRISTITFRAGVYLMAEVMTLKVLVDELTPTFRYSFAMISTSNMKRMPSIAPYKVATGVNTGFVLLWDLFWHL